MNMQDKEVHELLSSVELYQRVIHYLSLARSKLDATNCNGRLVGPDRELCQQIDELLENISSMNEKKGN